MISACYTLTHMLRHWTKSVGSAVSSAVCDPSRWTVGSFDRSCFRITCVEDFTVQCKFFLRICSSIGWYSQRRIIFYRHTFSWTHHNYFFQDVENKTSKKLQPTACMTRILILRYAVKELVKMWSWFFESKCHLKKVAFARSRIMRYF